jgi:hypothetical protein
MLQISKYKWSEVSNSFKVASSHHNFDSSSDKTMEADCTDSPLSNLTSLGHDDIINTLTAISSKLMLNYQNLQHQMLQTDLRLISKLWMIMIFSSKKFALSWMLLVIFLVSLKFLLLYIWKYNLC